MINTNTSKQEVQCSFIFIYLRALKPIDNEKKKSSVLVAEVYLLLSEGRFDDAKDFAARRLPGTVS